MGQKLILKDGTEFPNAILTPDNNKLSIIVSEHDLVDAAVVFGDPNKTEEMTYYADIHRNVYTGYTKLMAIQYFAEDESVQITMKGRDEPMQEVGYDLPDEYLPESMRKGENK